MRHCFPGFWKSIGLIEDPRDAGRTIYGLKHVLCLAQEHKDGSITYMHNVLETKAFKRLLPRIKQGFPRQPFVHLLDSLYANGPALKCVAQAHHQFICNFKRGSIPTLYDEGFELFKLHPENMLKRKTKRPGAKNKHVWQKIRWVNNIEYQGLSMGFVICEEKDCKSGEKKTFAWLTSFEANKDNVREIARGGRMQWKTENDSENRNSATRWNTSATAAT